MIQTHQKTLRRQHRLLLGRLQQWHQQQLRLYQVNPLEQQRLPVLLAGRMELVAHCHRRFHLCPKDHSVQLLAHLVQSAQVEELVLPV
jgi:hypothetical protein